MTNAPAIEINVQNRTTKQLLAEMGKLWSIARHSLYDRKKNEESSNKCEVQDTVREDR